MMYNEFMIGNPLFGMFGVFWPLVMVLMLLDIVLKGISLWISARQKQKYWFIALLVVNSVTILPIIYLLFFSKKSVLVEAKPVKGKKKRK
ncbi:MAG: DUF5652 family protein [Candidatus Woesearchaeota archaeon]